MPKFLAQVFDETKHLLLKLVTKTIPALILSIALFVGGIFILSTRIPGWSLFLGLPAIQIGIVFIIFTLDEVFRNRVGPESLKVVFCSVCGLSTLTPSGQKEDICPDCQKKIHRRLKEEKNYS